MSTTPPAWSLCATMNIFDALAGMPSQEVNSEFPILRILNFLGLEQRGCYPGFSGKYSNNLASRNSPNWNSQKIGIPKKLEFPKNWKSPKNCNSRDSQIRLNSEFQ
jgi:hypothetical protein